MKIISDTNATRIKESFDRICNNCSNILSETLKNSQLIITDDSNADNIYARKDKNLETIFKNAYSKGFGGMMPNVEYKNDKYHLVVLNITKIDEFELTDSELDGVFSHELGHIFNENPTRSKPVQQGKSFTPEDVKRNFDAIEKYNKTLQIEKEIYADYFSKRTNCSQGLLSSIEKYLGSDQCINTELFKYRLEQLKKEEILHGTIKPIE